MPGHFELKKNADNKYRFNLVGANGEIILRSEQYESKQSAEGGIKSVQTNHGDDARYAKAVASDGNFYFNLKAANGQVIGTSEMYSTEQKRDEGIASVKANGGTTVVKES